MGRRPLDVSKFMEGNGVTFFSTDDGSSPGKEAGNLHIRSLPVLRSVFVGYITIKEAAKILGVKEKSFYNRLESGKPFPIPVYKIYRSIRFKKEDVLRYKEEEM